MIPVCIRFALVTIVCQIFVQSAKAETSTDWIKLGMSPSAHPGGKPYPVFYSPDFVRRGDLVVTKVYANLQDAKGSELNIFRFDCKKNLWTWVSWTSFKGRETKGEVEFFSANDDPDLKHYQNKPVPTHEIKPGQDAGYGIMPLSLFKKLKELACANTHATSEIDASEMGRRAGIMQRALRGMSGDNPDFDKLMLTVERLQNQFGSNPDFKKAFNTSYEASMKAFDDHAATKEALRLIP